jgi:hypothetical protein
MSNFIIKKLVLVKMIKVIKWQSIMRKIVAKIMAVIIFWTKYALSDQLMLNVREIFNTYFLRRKNCRTLWENYLTSYKFDSSGANIKPESMLLLIAICRAKHW